MCVMQAHGNYLRTGDHLQWCTKRDMCPETAHYAWLRTSADVYERIILKSHFQGKEHTILIFETWVMVSVAPATSGREVQIPQHWVML